MKYFPTWYRLSSEDRYLIWISNERNSVVVETGGFIPNFGNLAVLRKFAALKAYNLENEKPRLQIGTAHV